MGFPTPREAPSFAAGLIFSGMGGALKAALSDPAVWSVLGLLLDWSGMPRSMGPPRVVEWLGTAMLTDLKSEPPYGSGLGAAARAAPMRCGRGMDGTPLSLLLLLSLFALFFCMVSVSVSACVGLLRCLLLLFVFYCFWKFVKVVVCVMNAVADPDAACLACCRWCCDAVCGGFVCDL